MMSLEIIGLSRPSLVLLTNCNGNLLNDAQIVLVKSVVM